MQVVEEVSAALWQHVPDLLDVALAFFGVPLIQVRNCRFIANQVDGLCYGGSGGAMWVSGRFGSIQVQLEVSQSVYIANRATSRGGGV